MSAEGIDPSALGAFDEWIAESNSRPLDQRDAIIGPAADRMARAAGLSSPAGKRAPKQQRAQQRKAQRAARRAQAQPPTLNHATSTALDTHPNAAARGWG